MNMAAEDILIGTGTHQCLFADTVQWSLNGRDRFCPFNKPSTLQVDCAIGKNIRTPLVTGYQMSVILHKLDIAFKKSSYQNCLRQRYLVIPIGENASQLPDLGYNTRSPEILFYGTDKVLVTGNVPIVMRESDTVLYTSS